MHPVGLQLLLAYGLIDQYFDRDNWRVNTCIVYMDESMRPMQRSVSIVIYTHIGLRIYVQYSRSFNSRSITDLKGLSSIDLMANICSDPCRCMRRAMNDPRCGLHPTRNDCYRSSCSSVRSYRPLEDPDAWIESLDCLRNPNASA